MPHCDPARLRAAGYRPDLPLSADRRRRLPRARRRDRAHAAAPAEMPIGVITAFFGAPFFAIVLRTSRRAHGERDRASPASRSSSAAAIVVTASTSTVDEGRVGRPDRPERRRQDDDPARDRRSRPLPRLGRRPGPTRSRCSRGASSRGGWRWCLRSPSTPVWMTVGEYVLLGRTPHLGDAREREGAATARLASRALERLDLLAYAERAPRHAERRRAAARGARARARPGGAASSSSTSRRRRSTSGTSSRRSSWSRSYATGVRPDGGRGHARSHAGRPVRDRMVLLPAAGWSSAGGTPAEVATEERDHRALRAPRCASSRSTARCRRSLPVARDHGALSDGPGRLELGRARAFVTTALARSLRPPRRPRGAVQGAEHVEQRPRRRRRRDRRRPVAAGARRRRRARRADEPGAAQAGGRHRSQVVVDGACRPRLTRDAVARARRARCGRRSSAALRRRCSPSTSSS